MKWIRVKDRKPNHTANVLCYTKKRRMLISFMDATMTELDDFAIDDEDEFTHWMPLPNPPKQ